MLEKKRKGEKEKVSVNGFDIFYTRRLFQRLLAAQPIQQMRQMAARAHVQPLGEPFYRHRRFHPQPLRQPHFENVSIAPHPQVVLIPPFISTTRLRRVVSGSAFRLPEERHIRTIAER